MTAEMLMTGYTASGGTLSGDALGQMGNEAWRLMLSQSRGRIREVESGTPEASLVQDCFKALVETGAQTQSGRVASETLGQWSRTYRDDQKTRDKLLLGILRDYLGETGLLYRGWPA